MKTKTITIAISALMAFNACQEAELKDSLSYSDASEIVFTATSGEEKATKTSRQDDGAIWWSADDEIKVFCGTALGQFVSQSNESAATATFAGSFDSSVTSDDIASKGVIAFYPYSDDVTCNGETVTFTLPSSQTGVAGTFDDDLFPAIAKSDGTDLSFYNICGGAKFIVARDDIKTVTLRGNNSEVLAGTAKVSFNESGLPQVEVVDGKTEIIVTAPDGGTFEVGKHYYIVALPQSLANGFTLTYNESEDFTNNSYKTDNAVTINRSKFGILTNLDAGLSITDTNDAIVFADDVMKSLCVTAFDTNGDGELSYKEAAAVTDLSQMTLTKKTFKSFDEFQYFTNVTTIPDSYFSGIGIKSIVLPEGLKTIGESAFEDCTSLKELQILKGVTDIKRLAFYGCSSLASITIPESVTSIGSMAFYGCSSLASITIPESVTSVGSSAFEGCSSLASITIPESVTSIGSSAFSGCTSLASITIPESVTSIGSSAFSDCTSLASITIPESVTSIGDSAFKGCSNINVVYYLGSVSQWIKLSKKFMANIWGQIENSPLQFGADLYIGNILLSELTIPDDITSIPNYAFLGCESIQSLYIAESVTSIGSMAFRGCTSLTLITIPESVTDIESSAFSGCTSLASITIPESVTSIGSSAFEGCSSLASITIPKSVTSIGSSAFEGCSSLASITIPESVTSIGSFAFHGCSSLASITIPESVTSIEQYAFYGCSSLTSITIPESVTSIEYGAFWDCSSLTSITIPESVTSIEQYVFWNCSSLTSITIPESVTSIEDRAFYVCSSLASITIPDSVTSIGSEAFGGCSSLASITIPENVASIGDYAFRKCTSLAAVYLKANTPTALGYAVFNYNASNRKFYVPADAIDTYKSADGWSDYASYIVGYEF